MSDHHLSYVSLHQTQVIPHMTKCLNKSPLTSTDDSVPYYAIQVLLIVTLLARSY